jgi:hypothetical protein
MRAELGLLLVGSAALAACSSTTTMDAAGGPGAFCAGSGASIALAAAPQAVTRNEPVDIVIRWELSERVSEPATATLIAGADGAVEVDLPLSLDPDRPGLVYSVTQLNPFGSGVPAGTVVVLASETEHEDCPVPATATTTFELQ